MATPIPDKYQIPIAKGLEWLKKTQNKDGSWSDNGQYPTVMTSIAGLAMLMEGSTSYQGKYAANIRGATDFLIAHSQKGGARNGLIGDPDNPGESSRYMYGHGFAMLFLASVYGDETDREQREKLKDILTRAVLYSGYAQSTEGGWYYKAKGDPPGSNNDEGSVTVTQMQGLRACRNAGIAVPHEIIKKGYSYLQRSTSSRGAVVYSLQQRFESPALTAAGIACLFSAGKYDDPLIKKWFAFCNSPLGIPITGPTGTRMGHDEYIHFYYAPSIFFLGEDGWEKMFPEAPKSKALTWSKYRSSFFDGVVNAQSSDGSWRSQGTWNTGAVFTTSVYLVIMQLDNNYLPIFQR